jgi:galactonate dehydratase
MSRLSRRELLRGTVLSPLGLLGFPALSAAVQAATSPYGRPKLKITDVRTAEVLAHGYQLHVRIYTDQGIFGHGEGTDAVHGGVPLVRMWRRFLVGQDPLNVDFIFERIRTNGIFAGAQAGQYVAALTAVEHALWDLAGKAVGLPVYQLLGGKQRDKVRIYCDSQTEDRKDPEAPKKIAQIRDMGFTAVKIDIDDRNDPMRWDAVNWTASNAEIDHMMDKIAFVRESFDKRVDLCVDMHGRYDLTTGKRVAKEAEKFKLLFLEEPVPAENVDAMRDIRESTSTPICCGENLFLRHGFREVLEKRAADIIMPDLQKCGGLLEGRKIADMAHTYYVPFAPHCVVSPIGTMASCHVCAAVPNFLVLEWHWIQRLDLWKDFVKEGEIIDKGFVTVADRPGFGVEMNEDAARKAQVPNTSWFVATEGTL